jgi:hypothetical protein
MKPLRTALPMKGGHHLQIPLCRLSAQFVGQRSNVLLGQQRRLLRRNPVAEQQGPHHRKTRSFHRVSFCARILFPIRSFSLAISCFFSLTGAALPGIELS